MSSIITGTLRKLSSQLSEQNTTQIQYQLPIGKQKIPLNPYIGKTISLTHTGNIFCSHCGKKTKKSYAQGHCFVCMQKLASCDMCIMKPETCHYAQGTCREPSWGEANCMIDHYVYLSNTSGVKVGITRHSQVPTRWIDQGATQALPICKVKSRYISGLVEIALAEHIADKTNWRTLLKQDGEPMPLEQIATQLLKKIEPQLAEIKDKHGADAIQLLSDDTLAISYPVTNHPHKIVSHNFDKQPHVSGVLQGIKGQYLIFDSGVINIRKFSAYEVTFSDDNA